MQDNEVINILLNQLSFSPKNISDLKIFKNELLKANTRHNFISKNTETVIWHRHILDSAQLVKFIDFSKGSLSDLGSGAGFPGLILALFNKNKNFHVKLYEKSPVKRAFLRAISDKLSIKIKIFSKKKKNISSLNNFLESKFLTPNEAKKYDIKIAMDGVKRSCLEVMGQRKVNMAKIRQIFSDIPLFSSSIEKQVVIDAHYMG